VCIFSIKNLIYAYIPHVSRPYSEEVTLLSLALDKPVTSKKNKEAPLIKQQQPSSSGSRSLALVVVF